MKPTNGVWSEEEKKVIGRGKTLLAARRLKEGIEEPRYCDNHETVLNSESIDAFVSDIVKAIAEEVKTATEAKMARGKYIYAHEVAEDAVEIIESFAQDKEEHGKV